MHLKKCIIIHTNNNLITWSCKMKDRICYYVMNLTHKLIINPILNFQKTTRKLNMINVEKEGAYHGNPKTHSSIRTSIKIKTYSAFGSYSIPPLYLITCVTFHPCPQLLSLFSAPFFSRFPLPSFSPLTPTWPPSPPPFPHHPNCKNPTTDSWMKRWMISYFSIWPLVSTPTHHPPEHPRSLHSCSSLPTGCH